MLIAATSTTGLFAGLLFGFACAVMPGLRRVDDAVFIAVMQSVNVRILNRAFLVCFVGAPVLTVAALVVELSGDSSRVWSVVAAVGFTVASYLITASVNVPLNNALEAAGDPAGGMDPAAIRSRFEGRWVRWNCARTVASTAAFGALVWALAVS